jgi:hypothetical protein
METNPALNHSIFRLPVISPGILGTSHIKIADAAGKTQALLETVDVAGLSWQVGKESKTL